MKLSTSSAVLVLFAAIERATAFGLTTAALSKKVHRRAGTDSAYDVTNISFVHRYPEVSKKDTLLYGILDDISAESSSIEENDDVVSSNNPAYEQLFEDLVFSTRDSKTVIAEQLEAYTDVGFVQYLENLEKDSTDDDERQALRALLDEIDGVVERIASEATALAKQNREKKETKQKQRLAEQAAQAQEAPAVKMTNADVLKRANAIDEAVVTAEASEDELPPDFIRDAKKEVGLAGFNNKGQMRVGGN